MKQQVQEHSELLHLPEAGNKSHVKGTLPAPGSGDEPLSPESNFEAEKAVQTNCLASQLVSEPTFLCLVSSL